MNLRTKMLALRVDISIENSLKPEVDVVACVPVDVETAESVVLVS
jgi:hypothetical protein